MKLNFTWGAALVLALATAVAAPAIARDDRHDRRGSYGHHRDHDRGRHDRHRDYGRYDRHRDRGRHDRRDGRRDRGHAYHYRPPVHVVHHRPAVRHVYHPAPRYVAPPPWARGRYVHHYDRPVYVVHDYRGYGLRHPPRGYRWHRDDYGDYLLVAIATGVIADIILRH